MFSGAGCMFFCLCSLVIADIGSACNFGPDCHFPCRCAHQDIPCDQTDGSCHQSGGCLTGAPPGYDRKAGWSGPGCQTGNVAFDKEAWQYGVYKDWKASKSVDGVVDRGQFGCSHPIARVGDHPWWMVDLGKQHKIYQIIYANTGEESYNYSLGMNFYVSNRSVPVNQSAGDLDGFSLCGHRQSIGHEEDAVIDCEPPTVGRYVMVYKTSMAYKPTSFVMSEVIVKAHIFVPCEPGCPSCTDVYGCVECPAGRKESNLCTESCDSGTYGKRCSEICSGHCAYRDPCNVVHGHCDRGCDTWWTRPKCELYIDDILSSSFTGELTFEVTSTTIGVSWPHLANINNEVAGFYGYFVKYKKQESSENEKIINVSYSTTERVAYTQITDLSFNTKYVVTLTPFREDGNIMDNKKNLAKTNTIKTKCISPGKAVITTRMIYNISISDSYIIQGVNMTWELPTDIGCSEITAVHVEYNTSATAWESVEAESVTSGVANPYYPGEYRVRITVVNNEDMTSTSDPIQILINEYGERPLSSAKVALICCLVLGGLCVAIVICCFWRKYQNDRLRSDMVDQDIEEISLNNHKRLSPADIVVYNGTDEVSSRVTDEDKCSSFDDPPSKDDNVSMDDGGTTDVEDMEIETYVLKSKDQVYENTSFAMRSIALSEIEDEFRKRTAMEDGLVVEINLLPGTDFAPCEVGQLAENKEKNRYRNILPYDHSRVILDRDSPSDSAYINASYIKGYNERQKAYVATQGPKPQTKGDFWKMIWKLKVINIVMLTPLVENRKKQCARYWPKDVATTAEYGALQVTLEAETIFADYTSRHLRIANKDKSIVVIQYHYLSWPDKSVPKSTVSLMAFLHMIRGQQTYGARPLVVHCSAGIGRTGTFIALDVLLEQAANEQAVSVYGSVNNVRRDRARMVQTLSQYTFLYEAMVDFAKTGITSVATSDFPSVYDQLKQSYLEEQYQMLQYLLGNESETKTTPTMDPNNKKKNRHNHIVPVDSNRPRLKTPYGGGTDYINASFVDSFQARHAYITTQAPLPNTVVDFWRLVYDHKSSTIIKLNRTETDCPSYWPDLPDEHQILGPLTLTLLNESPYADNVTKRAFKISLPKKQRDFYVDHYEVDLKSELPSFVEILNVTDLLHSLHATKAEPPIVMHCKDGVSVCGLVCAAGRMLGHLRVDHAVDVFVAARQTMSQNKHFINSLDQYDFLHQFILHYLKTFETYANFV